MKEIENFEKILLQTYPELENLVDRNYLILSDYIDDKNIGYQYSIGFPSEHRDKIHSLSKFCGVEFVYEYGTWYDKTIFETGEIFY